MTDAARSCLYTGDRNLSGKRVGVVGLARTGAACVRFLAERGAQVSAFDTRALDSLPVETQQTLQLAERVEAPYSSETTPGPLDMLVLSPGVPVTSPLVTAAREAGAEILGEVELAYRFCDAPMVAVTGTCGKGTTVTSLGTLLQGAGKSNVVAGNIGLPLIGQMERSAEFEVVVVEISSFQLETTIHFHPHIAALLNITEDHLERYPDFEAYVAAKQLLFRNQTAQDWAIFCIDDPQARLVSEAEMAAQKLTVSLADPKANARLEGKDLVLQLPGEESCKVASRTDLVLQADHHVINSLTAALAARICGVPAETMPGAFHAYQPADHLMTPVGNFGGVTYIDDSKATNPASAIADLAGIHGPVIVVGGGKEKDTDFADFGRCLAERAKAVILMGECAARIAEAVGRPELCHRVSSMEEAVNLAASLAAPGDTVALCPGCSSLDMFESYARRGDLFAEAAQRLASRPRTQE